MKSLLQIYFKGILMGISDLIPGISGGTIAFITGIYQRLILVLSQLSLKQFIDIFKEFTKPKTSLKKKSQGFFKKIKDLDFDFLGILFLGILTAIFLGATGISYVFENYTQYTLAFFIGLILSSAYIIFESISKKKHHYFIILFGAIIGASLIFLPQQNNETISLFWIFLGGFIASSAMILPGISGSFILLVLGIYPFVLSFLSSPFSYITELLLLVLGVIMGILFLSKLIHIALERYKEKVLSLLIGLILGGLLLPLRDISRTIQEVEIGIILFLFLLGIGAGVLLKSISKNSAE